MKKILITGGAGFIGYHLCIKLLKEGFKIDIVDNFKRGIIDFELKNLIKSKRINLIKSDLLNLNIKDWKRDYQNCKVILNLKSINNLIPFHFEPNNSFTVISHS